MEKWHQPTGITLFDCGIWPRANPSLYSRNIRSNTWIAALQRMAHCLQHLVTKFVCGTCEHGKLRQHWRTPSTSHTNVHFPETVHGLWLLVEMIELYEYGIWRPADVFLHCNMTTQSRCVHFHPMIWSLLLMPALCVYGGEFRTHFIGQYVLLLLNFKATPSSFSHIKEPIHRTKILNEFVLSLVSHQHPLATAVMLTHNYANCESDLPSLTSPGNH